MIRRREGNEFVLVTQTAHAGLSGAMAARIGNDRFAPLTAHVIRAIALHDAGWSALDAAMTTDAEGMPAHVFETPLDLALQTWSTSVDIAAAEGPYAGLLVSQHVLALSLFALGDEPGKPPRHTPLQVFEVNKFQHKQVEIQESLRRTLGLRTDLPLRYGLAEPGRSTEEDVLLYHFHLLQLLDRLSLDVCFDDAIFTSVDTVFPRPGSPTTTVHVTRRAANTFTVAPWPFDAPAVALPVPARRILARTYRDDVDLRDTYAAGRATMIEVMLREVG